MNDHTPDKPHVVERETHYVRVPERRRGGKIAGFLLAVLLIAGAIVAYLVVSDDDDDGQIDIEVPSVEVDVGE